MRDLDRALQRLPAEQREVMLLWVDKDFGYAISSAAGKPETLRIAEAVYRQMETRR